MNHIRKRSSTSNTFRTTLRNSSTGQGLTGLTSASSGLIISTICDNEAAATTYTAAGSTIETISTLGTFATPTATKCRFKEVDATNHPGLYEIQLANARFAVSSSRMLKITVSGATNLLAKEINIQLDATDNQDAAAMGLTNLDATVSSRLAPTVAARTLDVSATGEAGLDWANIGSPTTAVAFTGSTMGTVTTVTNQLTAAQIATGVWQDTTAGDFTTANSIGKCLYISNVVPGAAGGHFIAGSNAATTVNFTGSLSGSVGSVTGAVESVIGNVGGSVGSVTAGVSLANTAQTIDSLIINNGVLLNNGGAGGAVTIDSTGDGVVINAANRGIYINADTESLGNAGIYVASVTGGSIVAPNGIVATLSHVTLTDTLTTYTGNTKQTGDAYARLGAPAGASTAADIAAVKTDTATAATQSTAAASSAATAATQATAGATSAATANTTLTAIKGASWASTDNLKKIHDDVLAITGVTPSSTGNVYGDFNVAWELLHGPFRAICIGDSKTKLLAPFFTKLFVGDVPFGGEVLGADGSTTVYLDGRGQGSAVSVSFGAGGGYLPTSNYALNPTLEVRSNAFTVPSDSPAYINRICDVSNTLTFGTTDFPSTHRGTQVAGDGSVNWLEEDNTLRVMLYGTGNDMLNVEQTALNQANTFWGTKTPITPAALGTYHYIDSPIDPLPLTDDLSPQLKFVAGSSAIDGKLLAIVGWRLFRASPHWEFYDISRGTSSIDNYLDTTQYSLASWPGVLRMLETTVVFCNHGYNESDAYTEQDFYDRLVTAINTRWRVDDPNRAVVLWSTYNIAGAEARTLRNANAMKRVAADLPRVLFLDQRGELPDATANQAHLDVSNVHPSVLDGCEYFIGNLIDLIHRAAGMVAVTTGSGNSALGSGADSCTMTITDSDTSLPIADADVWISTDTAGANVVAGTLQTDSSGEVTFLLNAGLTYYLWMQKDGENSLRGVPFVAVAD